MHPLRREAVTGSRWRAYIPPSKRDSEDLTRRWNISSCLLPVCDYLADMVAHSGRAELPWERSSLLAYCGLNRIVHPNPYLLSLGMSSQLEGVGSWTSQLELETAEDIGRPTHPHVTMLMQHDCNGREDTILYGELASLVSAMHARANQFMVEKEEMERVFDMGIGAYSDKPRIFSRETRFPVLQISFLGPQHARVLYACMDRGHIVIRQSKLYSFERDDEAPLDLFIRILASKPLPKQL
ncbi:hypothetical protein BO78DRAFT_406325 [Aspergillus sclerotiicarbonarius CBS 121057]|uniref:Uncharacterized protein n=1 Tax=Aspergillus sclerotiicarbonarius (strain CBS 121057 / IBT 28362) TaxID=1448318 RepID=A0A319EC40_ASPSB|nr:hypothetical protein BO78DRAFT_406325 [Aspergillus sclerotiicarbonarius CBS 121057]